MNRFAMVLILVSAVGCERKVVMELKQADGSSVSVDAKKVGDGLKSLKEKEAALIEQLSKDQQPIIAAAVESVRKGLAEHSGSKAAEEATITPDPDGVESFGPQKWKVRGTLHAVESSGTVRDTKWETTHQVMFGKLQTTTTRLDVK